MDNLDKETGEIRPKYNERGEELMDPTPIAVPFKFQQRSQFDWMRQFIRQEVSRHAAEQGYESFEEANDFNVGDDFDPTTPYEEQFDPETGESNFTKPFVQEQPTKPPKKGGEPKAKEGENPPADPPVDNNSTD